MNSIRNLMIGIGLLAAQAALAHTELTASVPADSAMVAEAPQNVQLTFSEPVRLTALTIQLDGAAKQSLGPLPSTTAAEFTIALPALANGHYVIGWRALSADTHVMNGEFMFAVGADGSHSTHMDHSDAMPHDGTMPHDGANPQGGHQQATGDHGAHAAH